MEDEAPSTSAACTDLGLRFSRVQGEDAEHKPPLLQAPGGRGSRNENKKLVRNGEGMRLPLALARCRLPRMPHILRITTRQLFVALEPCGGEIRFCLCIRSSCKGAKRS